MIVIARDRLTRPTMVATVSLTKSHVVLSIAEPKNIVEMSEQVESKAIMPKIIYMIYQA